MTRRPDESAALRALRESLTEDGGGHPAEELLLEYADKRSSLANDVVAGIDAHLVQCPSCRDEVGVLDSMTIRPIHVTSVAEVRAERSVWERVVSALSGPVWRPVLALAVLVVLMVPTLRLIGQDRGLLFDMVEQHDDVAMTVNDDSSFQPSRARDIQALNGMAATKDERQARSDDEARATTIAPASPPAPPAEAAASVPSTPALPPAAHADAAPSPAHLPTVEDSLLAERHTAAARESESRSANAFSAQAMKRHRGTAQSPTPPAVDYVPGGRVSVALGTAERIVLRVRLTRAPGSAARTGADKQSVPESNGLIALPPTMSEIDLRVVAADDRQHTRRIEVGLVEDGPRSVVLVEIPADWLALGVNRVEISSHEEQPRILASPFSLALESRDQAVGDDGRE